MSSAPPQHPDQAIRRELREAVESSGAFAPGERVLALISGGADSLCLVHVLHELLGARLGALHVNHGLRAAAGADERFCEELCARLGVKLFVERVDVAAGNLEAAAREARYAAAERVRAGGGYDAIATGHTAGDQAETILYRLVTSPGRRALLGMRARSGALARPLLEVEADRTRLYCTAAGLEWREDESNEDRTLARNRLRHEVLPQLRLLHPSAERNVRATAAELRDEAELLEQAVDAAMREAGAGGSPPAVELARIAALPAALRRLLLRRLAEEAAGGPLPLGRAELAAIERLGAAGGSGEVSLGQGVRALCEYGIVRFLRAPNREPPAPVELSVPGSCRFGDWRVECTLEPAGGDPLEPPLGSPDAPRLDAGLLAPTLAVRGWREGDRMRPLGLAGTKSLQDLFVDRKVPRSLRRVLPVVESAGEIAWVAGVAVSERFRLTEATQRVARLDAFERRAGPGG